jgi:hypothetical protein
MDFARQLEHVAIVASLSAKITALENQFSRARRLKKSIWANTQSRLLMAKRVTMAMALAGAFLHFYFMDVSVQIMAMRPVGLVAHVDT